MVIVQTHGNTFLCGIALPEVDLQLMLIHCTVGE